MTPCESASTSKLSPALSSQDLQDTTSLLEALYSFGTNPDDDKKLAKLLRHTDHYVLGNGKKADPVAAAAEDDGDDGSYKITSWKMQDYAYKRDPCPYPTRARGLFTAGTDRIVARAYDKFFNVDEVSWTKVGSVFLRIFHR
jgi:tRNA ligase